MLSLPLGKFKRTSFGPQAQECEPCLFVLLFCLFCEGATMVDACARRVEVTLKLTP